MQLLEYNVGEYTVFSKLPEKPMLDHLLPRAFHQPIKWLGRQPWLKIWHEEGRMNAKIDYNIRPTTADYEDYGAEALQKARELLMIASQSSSSMMYLYQLGEAIANGPKLFRPTKDHCIGLENTLVTVPFEEYEQPYPTIILELPADYREHLKEHYVVDEAPRFVLCHKHSSGMITATAWFGKDELSVNVIQPSDTETVEEVIRRNRAKSETNSQVDFTLLTRQYGHDEAEAILRSTYEALGDDAPLTGFFAVSEAVQRLGLNFALMMTEMGTRIVGPLDKHHNKHVRQLKSSKEKDRKRAKRLLASAVHLVEFEQEVKFYDVKIQNIDSDAPSDGKRKAPRPHWRRGHWKMQPCGKGLQKRKKKFIKGLMVMKQHFVGDVADTTATYTGEDRNESA